MSRLAPDPHGHERYRHRRRHLRRWPRRVLIAVNAATVVSLVAVGAVYGYLRYRLDQIHTISGLPLTPGATGSADGSAPMNILLVGDNSRVGLRPSEAAKFGTPQDAGGSHSDVTMILHLDPQAGSASLLSIPRDLFVPLPPKNIAGSVGKIDSALNGSNFRYSDGAAQLITTITNDLGIPINHYVQINFDGFQQTIDALGGIDLSFPTRLYDLDASLHVTATGCLHLKGTMALAVVRARHLRYETPASNPSLPLSWPQEQASDLARIQRDHTFLRVFASTAIAQGLTTDLGKLNGFLGALVNQFIVDPGLKSEMIPLVKRFRHVDVNTVPVLTLPVTVLPDVQYRYGNRAYGQVDFPVEPDDHQVVSQWQGTPLPRLDPSTVTVEVRNLTNPARRAADIVLELAQRGYRATSAGQGPAPATMVETMLRYHPGSIDQAETVLQSLAGSVMMQSDPTVSDGTVALDAGSTVSIPGASAPGVTGPDSSLPGRRTSTTTTRVTTTTPAGGGNQKVSPATDQPSPWDPVPCAPGQPVRNA